MSGSPTSSVAGVKRKRGSDTKYYAVHKGKTPGVYVDWSQCQAQTTGHKGAVFKSFATLSDAEAFVRNGLSARTGTSGPQKWYGVKVGKTPGVYASWSEASKNVYGTKQPRYKAFATRAEAEAFVSGSEAQPQQPAADVNENDALGSKSKKKSTKKARDSTLLPVDINGPAPGDDYLPPRAEDGFDPRLYLNPKTGEMEYKTDEQLHATTQEPTTFNKNGVLKVWTDGSSRGNGTSSAIAGVGVYFGPSDKRNLAEPLAGPRQTNQRAELTAILRALELSPRDRPVMILSDSNYAIKCVTDWFQKWRSNGWVNSSNKPVENRDLIEKILSHIEERERISSRHADHDDGNVDRDEASSKIDAETLAKGRAAVQFVWVKGHASDQGNAAADKLAVMGASM